METTTVKKSRSAVIAPYYVIKGKDKFCIEEDLKPFPSKDEAKQKIQELSCLHNSKYDYEMIKFRAYKYHGRYFIYRLVIR
jgi:hypothetical protein